MNSSPFVVKRAALYEQVWAKPMLRLASEYRITGNGLAKACRKANIPVPPRGYWAKLKHGKRVIPRPPLPPVPESHPDIVIQPSRPATGVDPVVDIRSAAEQVPGDRIQVGEQLRHPHPLIQEAAAALAKAETDERGIRSSRPGNGTGASVLDVRVSAAARGRALRVLDALIKALESRGYKVDSKGALIEGQRVPIGLMEKDAQTPHVPTSAELARKRQYSWERIPTWDHAPSGKLSIYCDAYVWWRRDLRKRWSDGRTARLEDMLNDVVVGLTVIGADLKIRTDEERREADARAERERLRREQARQARMEKARRDNLMASTEAWTTAQRIKQLIAEVERRATSNGETATTEMRLWIIWAKTVVGELDRNRCEPATYATRR